ncbi:MAG TPA: short-chain oxidoreductase, partial [Psychrobacter sp.]|nr:short-chain oxidoreductase [Psychrobacter sp.]
MHHQVDQSTSNSRTDVTKPWQAPIDYRAMQRTEQRVIKQLLQALLYENIIDFDYTNANVNHDKALLDFTIKATDNVSYCAQGYIHYSFDLIRFNSQNVQRVVDGNASDAILEHVISDILLKITDASLKDSFIKELRHTLINETQAQRLSPNLPIPVDTLTYEQLE